MVNYVRGVCFCDVYVVVVLWYLNDPPLPPTLDYPKLYLFPPLPAPTSRRTAPSTFTNIFTLACGGRIRTGAGLGSMAAAMAVETNNHYYIQFLPLLTVTHYQCL